MINRHTIGYSICTVARKIHQHLTKEFKTYNITPEQWVVLKNISEEEGVSQKEIANKVEKDANTVKDIVDKLDKKLLIKKEKNKNDNRAFSLYLTTKGKNFVQSLSLIDEKMLNEIVSELDETDISNLNSILSKIESKLL